MYCGNCGKELASGGRFCGCCGTPISVAESAPPKGVDPDESDGTRCREESASAAAAEVEVDKSEASGTNIERGVDARTNPMRWGIAGAGVAVLLALSFMTWSHFKATDSSKSSNVVQSSDLMDTYIRSSLSNEGNYVIDKGNVEVGGWADWYYGLWKFNISELPQNVQSAVVRLYVSNTESNGWTYPNLSLWVVKGKWSERVRWPQTTTSATYVRDIGKPSGIGWFEIDITDTYRAWKNGSLPNEGIQLRPLTNNANKVHFVSSESGDAVHRPSLVLTLAPTSAIAPVKARGTADAQVSSDATRNRSSTQVAPNVNSTGRVPSQTEPSPPRHDSSAAQARGTEISAPPTGTWTGLVTQSLSNGAHTTYDVNMVINSLTPAQRAGTIKYASLECGGYLTLKAVQGAKFIFSEKIEYGQSSCVDHGSIHLTPNGEARASWQWFYSDGTRGASAELIRVTREPALPSQRKGEIPAAEISGSWTLRAEGKPGSNAVGSMNLDLQGTKLLAWGNSWRGEGQFAGRAGFYEWRFNDGRAGRTDVSVDDNGVIHGKVRGSGLDWNYEGTRGRD
jgi:hypothetical protein